MDIEGLTLNPFRRLRKEYGRAKTRRQLKGTVILMYHRVDDLPDYAYPIMVSPSNFAHHMAIIRKHYRPMRLLELADAIARRSLPDRGLVITFDDGYIDNFTQALPILEEYEIPATIFVSAGNIDTSKEFWWDELERIILKPIELPEKLEMNVRGQPYCWPTESFEERSQARKALHLLLKPLTFEEREMFLGELAQWAGQSREGRANHRSMASEELLWLSKSELIDIGGHTITHPQLSAQSYETQYHEVRDGVKRLEAITGKPVESFAYPYGTREDFNDDSLEIVRTCGFRAACTTVRGKVSLGNNTLFNLPRFSVDDWDREAFEYYLFQFFNT